MSRAKAAADTSGPNILVRPRIFTWQEVESADYAVYVENLRALGMPETTIRDIIVADIDQIFLQRQRADALQQDMEWWRAVPSPEMQSNLLTRTTAVLAAAFFTTSILLSILANSATQPRSILDTLDKSAPAKSGSAPAIPGAPGATTSPAAPVAPTAPATPAPPKSQ